MTSLISAARICISRLPARRLGAALGHLLRQPCQLRLQASIVYRAADVEREAAQQLGIDLRRGQHLAPLREPPRELDELGALRRAQRGGRADRHARAAELVVEK